MHMSDALLSPAVGGLGWAVAAGLGARSARVLRRSDGGSTPLMGVLGAFVFAAQMVNFSIPGTGASGHIGGGMLLAVALGPYAAFLVMASVLVIQALFFADGGLLALGCNVLNLAFCAAFIAYPLVFRPLAGACASRARVITAAIAACVLASALGATGVVLETFLSHGSSLPLRSFFLLMVPVHVVVGLVEGVITGAIVLALWRARPELVRAASSAPGVGWPALTACLVLTAATAGGLSLAASDRPDGLEWSLARASPQGVWAAGSGFLDRLQARTALLPDYGFKRERDLVQGRDPRGTSLSGIVGAAMTLAMAAGIAVAVRRRRRGDARAAHLAVGRRLDEDEHAGRG